MGLKLTIQTNKQEDNREYALLFASSNTVTPLTLDLNEKSCTVSWISLSFDKQMYKPGKIVARLQISASDVQQDDDKSYYLLNKKFLKEEFLDGTVTLEETEESVSNYIAQLYKVYEVIPIYDNASLYVDLICYSPDKELTKTITSKVFVAKQLGREILQSKADSVGIECVIAPQNKLYRETSTDADTNDESGDKSTNEYIHPYLVQYNESFYDMLIRTANRWGEFVYFEGGKLVFGRNSNTASDMSSYTSISYLDDTVQTPIDENRTKAVVSDDYLAVIKKSHKPEYDKIRKNNNGVVTTTSHQDGNEYILQAGDLYTMDNAYNHKVVQSFLNMKSNMWDWFSNMLYDDGITAAQNEHILYHREKEYNQHFFDTPLDSVSGDSLKRLKKHYSKDEEKRCQFAYYDTDTNKCGGLTANTYNEVLDKEITAGKTILSIDLGNTYQHLCLGDDFKFAGNGTSYLVTGVRCETETTTDGNGNTQRDVHYYVTAIEEISTGVFYPFVLPSGHIRFSGPQRGTVQDTLDPMLNGRYRVLFTWQGSADDASPWLRVAREMSNDQCGGVWQLEKGTEVLLDFQDGNVELPYIVGTLQDTVKRSNARSTMFNNLDLTTPAGHAIRLTDGEGGGIANLFASFQPIWKMQQGFNPQNTKQYDWHYGKESKYFEGGMELTDKYGFYSIKASTDQRNISIKSPWGDVLISAFTGITISAPNGDVKIQGKNVSIEARNNLTLTSGTNIADEFWGGSMLSNKNQGYMSIYTAAGLGQTVVKTLFGKVLNQLDIPILRHMFELIIHPVAGLMTLDSKRFVGIKAGIKLDGYTNGVQSDDNANLQIFQGDKGWKDGSVDAWLRSNNNLYNAVRGIWYRVADDEKWGPNQNTPMGDVMAGKDKLNNT